MNGEYSSGVLLTEYLVGISSSYNNTVGSSGVQREILHLGIPVDVFQYITNNYGQTKGN